MNPAIVSHLIEAGFRIYLPIDGSSELVIKNPDGSLRRVIAQTASVDNDKSPIARISDEIINNSLMLVVCDPVTQTVWLLDSEIIGDFSTIRLGKKYEDCIMPEPTSLDWKQQRDARTARSNGLKEAARSAMKKERQNVLSESDE